MHFFQIGHINMTGLLQFMGQEGVNSLNLLSSDRHRTASEESPYGTNGTHPPGPRGKIPPLDRATANRENSLRFGDVAGPSKTCNRTITFPVLLSFMYRGSFGGFLYICCMLILSSNVMPGSALPEGAPLE